MKYIVCSLIGYCIGTINPSFLIAKKQGVDIRKEGSGNAGASNALIILGKLTGVICALLDISKACLALFLTQTLFPGAKYAFAITGTACIVGHIYPFYMKFKGGKGLACLGGIILYYNWRVFLIMLAIEIIIALATDYICFVPLTASVAFPIVYVLGEKNIWGGMILFIATTVMIIKHIENLKRIRSGTEMRLSYLWHPDPEIERIKNNLEEDTSDENSPTTEKTSK